MELIERRKKLRAPLPGKVVLENLTYPLIIKGAAFDICANGMFISTRKEIKEGTQVRLTFCLPDGVGPFTVYGQVRWVRRKGSEAGPRGIGIQFTDAQDIQQIIDDYAEQKFIEEIEGRPQ